MKRATRLFCASLALGCGPSPDASSPSGDGASDNSLPEELLGNYQETLSQAKTLQHEFGNKHWHQGQDSSSEDVEMQLQELRAIPPQTWALVYSFRHKASNSTFIQRIDLYQPDPQTLWLCRHPSMPKEIALSSGPGNSEDLEGQGCIGAPWRKLTRVSSEL